MFGPTINTLFTELCGSLMKTNPLIFQRTLKLKYPKRMSFICKDLQGTIFTGTELFEIHKSSFIAGNLKVSIKIYSGLPDPEWQVVPSDPNYNKIEELLNTARAGGFVLNPFKDMPARLGFKGFTIQDTTKGIKDLEYIFGPHTAMLQQLLLKSMPSELLPGKIREDLSEKIRKEALSVGVDQQEGTSSDSPTATCKESGN